jgi:hypoxanthine phosphoribosyltransferase
MSEAVTALLSRDEVAALVEQIADRIFPRVGDDATAVCLLTGGIWFAADLTRALHARGRNLRLDALWLSSYGDDTASSGRCEVRADLQRPVEGRQVLVIDDVFDSGLSLQEANRRLTAAGAAQVLTAVFARKPWPEPRVVEPDFVAWEAPARFLVGYGMDAQGCWRGYPGVAALD